MYVHSETFEHLKFTKESISNNLTSSQYLIPLDYILNRALQPVVEQMPTLLLNFLGKVLAHQALRPNIKFNFDKGYLIDSYPSLVEELTLEKLDKVRLNRGIKFTLLAEILRYQQMFRQSANSSLYFSKREAIAKSLGVKPSMLYVTLLEVEYWYKKAVAYKGMIAEKFTRMTLNQAQKAYVDFNHAEPLDDITQVFMYYLNKAIDRCDSKLGVLTTYISSWLTAARHDVRRQIEAKQETSLDSMLEDAPNLEHLGSVPFDDTYSSVITIAKLAAQIDVEGAVRTSLGIPQYLNLEDRRLLERYAKP